MLHRTRHAFTLIELLVVISIIAVLAALILTGAQALGIGSKKEKTRTILAAVSKGINLTIANKGGSISPVEHPLAGSRAPRFVFKRFMPPTDTGTGAVPAGAALDTSGIALSGLVAISQLPGGGASPAGSNDLMLPSDLYADQASFLLFGLKREYIGTLGALQKRVTKYILLPKPLQGQASLPSTFPTLTAANLPQYTIPTDSQDADSTFGHPSANKQAIDYVFGSSNVQAELSSLNALYLADPTTAANQVSGMTVKSVDNAFRNPINQTVITSAAPPPTGVPAESAPLAMLYTDAKPEVNWKPGCIYVTGGTPDYDGSNTQTGLMLASGAGGGGGGMWVHYRLPGLAIYDAWKNEVLYTISSQGGIRLMSAGADGVFQFDPGINHVLDSTDPEMSPVGDDKDGSKDNVNQRVEEQQ